MRGCHGQAPLNEKIGFITLVSSFSTCGYLRCMPRTRPLTLARGFKFQTASHEFSLTFFRALHCSQTEHAHKLLSIPHADTVTEAGRQKFASIATIYECVWEPESKLCCYDSYQEKSLPSNITIKIDHHEPKSMLCMHHRCFRSFVISLKEVCF